GDKRCRKLRPASQSLWKRATAALRDPGCERPGNRPLRGREDQQHRGVRGVPAEAATDERRRNSSRDALMLRRLAASFCERSRLAEAAKQVMALPQFSQTSRVFPSALVLRAAFPAETRNRPRAGKHGVPRAG